MERKLGSEMRVEPNRKTVHPRGGARLWVGTVFAGLAALACAQTIQPDLSVTLDGGYRNVINGVSDGLKLQTTCPTGTTFFWASEVSRYYDPRQPDKSNPHGAYLAYGTYKDDTLEAFHLAFYPTVPSMTEGNIVLDCFSGDNRERALIDIKRGKYQITRKP